MNAVEIDEAISALAERPFDAPEFPYAFLEAFGNKDATLKRLRKGETNKSDLGGVLQTNNIHIATCPGGMVSETLAALKASPATARAKAKFVLATDGEWLEAEDLVNSDNPPIACAYTEISNHFGTFLPLAGISTVRQISENAFDIRATGRLNKLYLELLKENPEWGTADRRDQMNHFMARLIFCFFADHTDIFNGTSLFTQTVLQMSARDASDTHIVISDIFRAMNTPVYHQGKPDNRYREAAGARPWANQFPYVNGGLFADSTEVPRFNKAARSFLLSIGGLDWKQVNPDIFGSMIQAVADDEERGALGMHYTSRPNILKVLNPLFLDDLRAQLAAAEDNARMLLNLRKRMTNIRVFDPACGSGNFLVIAYKEIREIEVQINRRRDEPDRRSDISLKNFRGIELRNFPAEIARLALIIAQYQCDVLYRGQMAARLDFLPLDGENWIVQGNALRLDWLTVCPPTGTAVRVRSNDLLETPLEQTEVDFENEGGETYICGNPPYLGSTWQTPEHKSDLKLIFDGRAEQWKSLDYVSGWFMKACDYGQCTPTVAAFVSTNSICQGQQVPILWPLVFKSGHEVFFAHTSFKWANLASHNAGVTVVIVGIAKPPFTARRLYDEEDDQTGKQRATSVRDVMNINAYLVPGPNVIAEKRRTPFGQLAEMSFGNKPVDGGNLLLSAWEVEQLGLTDAQRDRLVRRIYGSAEFIRGQSRYCLWIEDKHLIEAMAIEPVRRRIADVRTMRLGSRDNGANEMAERSHQFREMYHGKAHTIVVPRTSSETRPALPVGLIREGECVTSEAFALYDAPLWNMAFIASRLHIIWIATVCGKLKTDFRYSNTLGWNTFPVPALTEKNKADLTRCAEDILLAREHYFPATIADMYDPERMDNEFPQVRAAHERNDETLERIYIGRRFKNDTERLEHLFDRYAKMVAAQKLTLDRTRKKA